MSETTNNASKAVSTIQLATTVLGLLKSFALVFGVVLIEWVQKKKKLAENQAAVSDTSLNLNVKHTEIQKDANEKGPDKVIADFLGD